MKKKPEYVEGEQAVRNFDQVLTDLMKVPHSEIKAKLDAEKQRKKVKRERRSK